MSKNDYDVTVIGAGHNGLTAAASGNGSWWLRHSRPRAVSQRRGHPPDRWISGIPGQQSAKWLLKKKARSEGLFGRAKQLIPISH